jgi:hypothetical protein
LIESPRSVGQVSASPGSRRSGCGVFNGRRGFAGRGSRSRSTSFAVSLRRSAIVFGSASTCSSMATTSPASTIAMARSKTSCRRMPRRSSWSASTSQ